MHRITMYARTKQKAEGNGILHQPWPGDKLGVRGLFWLGKGRHVKNYNLKVGLVTCLILQSPLERYYASQEYRVHFLLGGYIFH